ncbi:hypothetical protein ACVCIH_06445 [Burkholderia glumae]|uniref:hypothetical protein n=1 Tax=Burkholderia glumae TaxID=337 RepID=UPI001373EDCA|nr:hypothetical protein [Burkholderia glumae]QHP94876.1 hypothetical protein EXE55_28670 [Burkholderia glumae]
MKSLALVALVCCIVCYEARAAQDVGSAVEASRETFACASLDDAKTIAERLNAGDDSRRTSLVASHACVSIRVGVPWQVQRIEGDWIQIAVPGIPAAAEWSPSSAFVAHAK